MISLSKDQIVFNFHTITGRDPTLSTADGRPVLYSSLSLIVDFPPGKLAI